MNQDDKQFMMQFMIVLGALLAFTVVIFIIARVLMSYNTTDYGPLVEKQVEERTAPVGEAYSGEVPEGAQQASAGGDSAGGGGEQTYAQVCAACHDSGAGGAPRLTDKAAWQPRIEQGKQTLYDHAINGLNAMPPKGGDPSLSDEQVQAAVDHIVDTVSGGVAAGGKQAGKASAEGTQTADGQAKADQANQKSAKTGTAAQPAAKAETGAGAAGIQQAAARGRSPENKSIYQTMCSACHDSGALDAPKVTDKAVWQARIAKGAEALYGSAISGIGAMPPKGGHSQLSEAEVKKAVDYIIAQVSGTEVAGDSGGAKQPAKPAAPGKSSAAGKTTPSSQPKGGDAQGKQTDAKGAAAAGGQPEAKSGKTQDNAAGGASLAAGKKTYESVCATCHGTGTAGAPKYGDKAAWASHLKEGKAHLYETAINGKGAMPPKGGNPQLSEGEVKAAVDYLLNAVQ